MKSNSKFTSPLFSQQHSCSNAPFILYINNSVLCNLWCWIDTIFSVNKSCVKTTWDLKQFVKIVVGLKKKGENQNQKAKRTHITICTCDMTNDDLHYLHKINETQCWSITSPTKNIERSQVPRKSACTLYVVSNASRVASVVFSFSW